MNRSLSTLSAVAAGLAAAAALHFTAHSRVPIVADAVWSETAAVVSQLVSGTPAVQAPAGRPVENPVAPPPREPAIAVVLLAEPIVILHGNQFSGLQLPRGTHLDVIADEGACLKVRYADSVITIPRTAIMQGVFARNLRLAHT